MRRLILRILFLISRVVQKLYMLWVLIVFSVFMLLFLPGIILPFLFGSRAGWLGYWFIRLWAWVFSLLTFIRYDFYGQENFKPGRSYIYVSNHTSFLDLPGLRMLLPGQFRPLAKKELKKIPVFGWIAQAATVIVDRSSAESKRKSMERLKLFLQQGISILIFAEGTQNRTKEILQPFKDGAFRMAIDTKQPLLPMVIVGAGKLMPPGTVRLQPGRIKIVVGEAIETTGSTNANIQTLKQKTFEIMKNMILENSK